jgi:hypothetical protein
MKIEIVEFYPGVMHTTSGGAKILGTMHIFIDDFSLDIRGIVCLQTKLGLTKCFLPCRKIIGSQGSVRMPYVNFTNLKVKQEVLKFLKNDCVKYVHQRLAEKDEAGV